MMYVRKQAKEFRRFCCTAIIAFSEDAVSGWSEHRIVRSDFFLLLKINFTPKIK